MYSSAIISYRNISNLFCSFCIIIALFSSNMFAADAKDIDQKEAKQKTEISPMKIVPNDFIPIAGNSCYVIPESYYPRLAAIVTKVKPEDNAAGFYLAAINLELSFADTGLPAHGGKVDNDKIYLIETWENHPEELKAFIEKSTSLISCLDKASERKGCAFPFLASEKIEPNYLPFNILLPYLEHMRSFAKFRVLLCNKAMSEGNTEEAVNQLCKGFSLGRHLNGSFMLVNKLVSVACDHILLLKAEELLNSGQLTSKDIARLSSSISEALTKRIPEADWLTSEKDMIFSCLDIMGKSSIGKRKEIMENILGSSSRSSARNTYNALMFSKDTYITELEKYLKKLHACYSKPYHQAKKIAATENINNWGVEDGLAIDIIKSLFAATERLIENATIIKARFDLICLASAFRLYEMDNGKLPSSIKEVEGTYHKGNLTDRFSGNSYLMHTETDDTGKKLIYLYSTGPNLKDNKGKFTKGASNADDVRIILSPVESNKE